MVIITTQFFSFLWGILNWCSHNLKLENAHEEAQVEIMFIFFYLPGPTLILFFIDSVTAAFGVCCKAAHAVKWTSDCVRIILRLLENQSVWIHSKWESINKRAALSICNSQINKILINKLIISGSKVFMCDKLIPYNGKISRYWSKNHI